MTAFSRLRSAAAVALMFAWAPGPDGLSSAAPLQRDVRERHVFISVLDSHDAPVRNVPATDFIVREDDIAREVLRAGVAAPPSHVVLLVDDSQATDGLTVDIRTGLKSFVGVLTSAASKPSVRLATFGDRPTTRVEFTTTPTALVTGIDRIFARPGAGGTLLEALIETTRDLRTRQAERPAIVVFLAESGPEFSNESEMRVADVLREAGVSLWAVVLEDQAGQNMSDGNRQRAIVMGDVLRRSGGFNRTVLSKQGIDPAFRTIATALTSQYDITYARPESLIPPTKLDVSLRQGSHRVIAPAWARP